MSPAEVSRYRALLQAQAAARPVETGVVGRLRRLVQGEARDLSPAAAAAARGHDLESPPPAAPPPAAPSRRFGRRDGAEPARPRAPLPVSAPASAPAPAAPVRALPAPSPAVGGPPGAPVLELVPPAAVARPAPPEASDALVVLAAPRRVTGWGEAAETPFHPGDLGEAPRPAPRLRPSHAERDARAVAQVLAPRAGTAWTPERPASARTRLLLRLACLCEAERHGLQARLQTAPAG